MVEVKVDPVLIVGAGPVGLAAALMLARHGIPVRIVDRNGGPTDLSKAAVVWQRTLETLEPVLPFQRFSQDHPTLNHVEINLGSGSIKIDVPSEAGKAPACALVPQSATERILLAAVEKLGVTVERQTELTSFTADDDGVSCELMGPEGITPLRASWLIACDGAHSTVRHGLKLAFPGDTIDRRWMLADINIECDPEPQEDEIIISLQRGIAALFPMGDKRWRLIADYGGSETEAAASGSFTIDQVQSAIDASTDLGWKVTQCHWTSDFGVNERQIEQYVHGRILLAGDAAHVHSPAGGQGMNTGIQDAANLAWKLALVYKGAASSSLMDTYQTERHPVGESVLVMTGKMLKFGMVTGAKKFMRDLVGRSALPLNVVQRRVLSFLTEESVNYRNGPLSDDSGTHGGAQSGDVWPLSFGAQAELVLLGDASRDQAPTMFGGAQGFPLTVTRIDEDSRIADRLGSVHGAVLVRPDGVVASVGKNAAEVAEWMDKKLPQ